MRIRPLEVWVFFLLVSMVGVGIFQQHLASERLKAQKPYYQMTVKAPPR